MHQAGNGARFTNWKGKVGMKHSELIIRIIELSGDDRVNWKFYPALRSVVNFHKPFDFKLGSEMFTSCEGCGEAEYPCPTIKVIEDNLV